MGSTGMIQGTMVTGPNRMAQMMTGNMSTQGEISWQTQGKPRRPNEMIMINVTGKHPGMGGISQITAEDMEQRKRLASPGRKQKRKV